MKNITRLAHWARVLACTVLVAALSASGNAATWVTIKASTPEQIIRAMETASATRTPTTIVVAPGHYKFPRGFETGFGRGVLPLVTSTVFIVGQDAESTRNVLTGELNEIDPPPETDCVPEELGACLGGGGIWTAAEGTTTSARSIIAENVMPVTSPRIPGVGADCNGQIQSEGFNALGDGRQCQLRPSHKLAGRPAHDQINIDPRLGDLQDNGTSGNGHMPLLAGSSLIDADGAVSEICTFTDQLGQRRVDADADGQRECDIGAIEFQ